MRTYYTTFSFERMLDALESEGIRFKEGVKGRVFFRLPGFPEVCVEFCRGGVLMLKGSSGLEDLSDDRLIAELFKVQCKRFPSTSFVSYKLSSVHASRKWLRSVLAECIEVLTGAEFGSRNKLDVTSVLRLLTSKGRLVKNEAEAFRCRRLQQYFKLLLRGRKDSAFTPLPVEDVFRVDDKHLWIVLNPKKRGNATLKDYYNTVYLFNPQIPRIKPPDLLESPGPDGYFPVVILERQDPAIEDELFKNKH